jgi:hypothetical protein
MNDTTMLKALGAFTAVCGLEPIQGGPETTEYGQMVHIRAHFMPHHRTGVDHVSLWLDENSMRIQVSGQYVAEGSDVETQGFGHCMASKTYEDVSAMSEGDVYDEIVKLSRSMR